MQAKHYFVSDMLKGKTAFITGGGSGINLGVAEVFASLGANIGICGRTESRLEQAAAKLREYGTKVEAYVADVRDFDALAAAFAKTKEAMGPIGILVCGAAGNFICPAEKLSANGFKAVVDIDLLGSFNASRAAFSQLKETRGVIIFISAGMSITPYFAQAHVGAAKAGIDNLMKNLALEWGRFGIRANSICPGPIEQTEGMRRLAPGELADQLARAIPLQRFGQAAEIGHAAAFLASPMAAYITGTLLVVDGGQNLPGSGLFSQLISSQLDKQATQA